MQNFHSALQSITVVTIFMTTVIFINKFVVLLLYNDFSVFLKISLCYFIRSF